MNEVRITIIVKEMDDNEAIELKKALVKMLEPKTGTTVTMTLRPSATPSW